MHNSLNKEKQHKRDKAFRHHYLNNLNLLRLLHINKKNRKTPTETWGKYHEWAIQKRKNENADNHMKKCSTK